MAISVTIARTGRDERSATYLARRTFDLAEVTIGSDPARDVCLPDAGVRPLHARLVRKGDAYVLVGEGADGGTLLDGAPLEPKRPRRVRGGEVVQLGPYRLELAVGPASTGKPAESTFSFAAALFERETEGAREQEAPRIEVADGPDRRKRLLIEEGRTYALGRDPDADLQLEEPEASRRHARLTFRGGVLFVCDLGSANGTYLHGKRLPTGEDVAWPAGAELCVGDDKLIYRDPLAEELAALEEREPERSDVSTTSTNLRPGFELQNGSPPTPDPAEAPASPSPESPPETELEAPAAARAVAAFARSDAQGAIAEPPSAPPPAPAELMHPPIRGWLADLERSDIVILCVAVGVGACALIGLALLLFAWH